MSAPIPQSGAVSGSKPAPPKDPAETFWITRDRLEGVLADAVDIWLVRPERIQMPDGDAVWVAPIEDIVARDRETHAGSWTIVEARVRLGGGLPENDRECTCVGGEQRRLS